MMHLISLWDRTEATIVRWRASGQSHQRDQVDFRRAFSTATALASLFSTAQRMVRIWPQLDGFDLL